MHHIKMIRIETIRTKMIRIETIHTKMIRTKTMINVTEAIHERPLLRHRMHSQLQSPR